MKQIQPITIWINGEEKIAEYISVTGSYDNNSTEAKEFWQLYTKIVDEQGVAETGEQIAQGNVSISGQDYINWGDQPAMNVNAWIYDWVAQQINAIII
jgi:hypothetical protein